MRDANYDVLIIGGGFSGTALAIQLLRRSPHARLAIVDAGSAPGRGLAYATAWPCHLLNVSCGSMSAFPSEPRHFLDWARARLGASTRDSDFLPRAVYGEYVSSLLDDSLARHSRNFRWIRDEAVALESSAPGITLATKSGARLRAKHTVLATGNFPPAKLKISGLGDDARRFFRSSWASDALEGVSAGGSVLLIGSGLTSADLAVALESKGFAGVIHILSRHGLLPHTHGTASKWPQFVSEAAPITMRRLVRLVRSEVQRAAEAGVPWTAVVDALRPVTRGIWQSLPDSERRRFLRHVRTFWEVHRHRVAPEIGATIRRMMAEGRIQLHAGRATHYREDETCAELQFRPRGADAGGCLAVDRVINCTGPETDFRRIPSPLIQSLLQQGLAVPDALSLGLNVDVHGALINGAGEASHSLFALGPARKGSLWETTAVPEIRVQASDLAELLAGRLQPHATAARAGAGRATAAPTPLLESQSSL
jgi:uncharacterized NAD(P)/FAD-binding protein YdhS